MTGYYLLGAFTISGLIFLNKNKTVNIILLFLFLLLQWAFTIFAFYNHKIIELEYFTFDSLGLLMLSTLSIIAVPAFIHSYNYLERRNETARAKGLYYASMILLLTSISAAYLANHISVTWIFTEITTLSASALIYHHRNKLSLEGTWKYVFICAISVTFIFIGILFLSLSLQNIPNQDLFYTNLISNAGKLNSFWLKLAFLFIFTGFTAKLGLVPMYTAGIDAKDNAPAPAGALLASVLMNVGFVGIFRFYTIVAQTQIHSWANVVITIAAVLSVFIATVYMSKVMNIKRMFAYSGIEHMGLVMLGLAAGGVGYYAAVLHVILHAFVKSSLFFQFSQIFRIYRTKNIYQVGNYFKYDPIGAMVILFAFISATAMPPSGLFVSEFLIFRALFESHQLAVLIIILVLLTIIIWAFGKNIFKILFTPPVDFNENNIPENKPWESVIQFFLLFGAVWLGLNPPQKFFELINDAIAVLPL